MPTSDPASVGAQGMAGRMITTLAAAAVALVTALTLSATAAAAGPYEPNDSIPSAAGPLATDQTYAAAIETPGDRDFFYFHVTSDDPVEVSFELKNLGGGTYVSDVDAVVMDASATPVGTIPFVGQGENRIAAFTLKPQKYLIEILAREGFGDKYLLTTAGGDHAFGDYGLIATRCAEARTSAKTLRAGLERAKTKLQRATSRVRRSRYSSRDIRAAARSLYRKAKARVAGKRDALKTATELQTPWCSIPP